ncbi:MAG: sodium:calcium antiporter [Actinomycetia bacterium]|nr:sodium:calcium antiporter [Actinomycetes bacterium]
MIALWLLLVAAGLTASVLSGGRALTWAEDLGHKVGLAPHIIGLTIVAIGTDLPEIANSIIASAEGRGDLNVGDSTGSAATQITLVLGILCLIRPIPVSRRFVAIAGGLTVVAFGLGALLMSNGSLSHLDGALLVSAWIVATIVLRYTTDVPLEVSEAPSGGAGAAVLAGKTLLALAVVAVGATVAVTAFGRVVDELGVPEYATSFLLLAFGTSLPELIVNARAVRAGMVSLAIGGIIGASLIDATLSLGIGPLIFPTDVSSDAAWGTLMVGGVVALAVLLLLRSKVHGRLTGVLAIGLYLVLFPVVIL